MKIWHFIPYSLNRDLATEINEYVKLVPNNEDWICVYDGDIMFTRPNWGSEIAEMIKENQDFDLLTCLATRIGIKCQSLNNQISQESNLVKLADMVNKQFDKIKNYRAKQVSVPIGGFLLCFRKKLAIEIPFISSDHGILGVDGQWSKALLNCGKRIGVCQKIVLIHYYRLHKLDHKDTTHLQMDNKSYMTCTVDKTLVIPPNFKGIFPNKVELRIDMVAGVSTPVPDSIIRFFTKNHPKIFKRSYMDESEKVKQKISSGEDNKLSILVATNHLKSLGGSETFTYTLANELRRQGYEPDIFTFHEGLISEKLMVEGFSFQTKDKYDLILANHITCVNLLHTKGFTIQTCHSTKIPMEQPSRNADQLVAISEEIKGHIRNKYKRESTVILNGIDCERFKPVNPINDKLTKVLSLSHSEELNQKLKTLFNDRGIEFATINKYVDPVWNIEDYINDADMVIGLGRSAYEAMACGRPVLILDQRKYQGVMGDGLFDPGSDSIINNCSGRMYKINDIDNLVDDSISGYEKESLKIGNLLREFALDNLNIELQVKKYLEIYESNKI